MLLHTQTIRIHPQASDTCIHAPDSKILFDIISKGSRTNEKRIMLDIYAARKAYKELEISNNGFLETRITSQIDPINPSSKKHYMICSKPHTTNRSLSNGSFEILCDALYMHHYIVRKREAYMVNIKHHIWVCITSKA